jgi:hypothetical protein
MTGGGEVLLEGPRGRRLCLELAMELDPDIRTMVFRLGYDLDSGRGSSRMTLTFGYPDDAGAQPSSPPAPPGASASPVNLAAALTALDVTGVEDAHVQGALERAVDTARYWQEPDGEDGLAGLPVIRKALLRLARSVLASPGAQWWTKERAREQWAIDWRPAADPTPLPKHLPLAEWGQRERAEEAQAATERPSDPHAPWSGWWWSAPQGIVRTVGHISAALNLVEDSLRWEVAAAIPVRGAGRTLEIRTPHDWTSLCRRFPLEVTASRRHVWFNTTGRNGRWVIPDWELVAAEWDAVHLTVLGYLSGAGRALHVDAGTATVIAGWDPDSTIWLTDVAREWEGPRLTWHRSGQGEPWTQVP